MGEANGTFNVLVDIKRLLAHGRLQRVLGVGQVRQGDSLADRGLVHRAPVGGGDLSVAGKRAAVSVLQCAPSIGIYRSYLAEERPPVENPRLQPQAQSYDLRGSMEGSSDRLATYLAAKSGADGHHRNE